MSDERQGLALNQCRANRAVGSPELTPGLPQSGGLSSSAESFAFTLTPSLECYGCTAALPTIGTVAIVLSSPPNIPWSKCRHPNTLGVMADFDLVLFDLGGVLIEVPGVRALGELAGIEDDATVWQRWLTCEWARRFERGRCSIGEFAAGFVADWSIPLSSKQFEGVFRSWTRGLFEGAAELVSEVRNVVRVACLSNSNALQWAVYQSQGVEALFDLAYLSHELDLIKPDREIFDHVIAATKCEPARLLFLDDNQMNVDAAIGLGLMALRVQGVEEARRALLEVGVLAR